MLASAVLGGCAHDSVLFHAYPHNLVCIKLVSLFLTHVCLLLPVPGSAHFSCKRGHRHALFNPNGMYAELCIVGMDNLMTKICADSCSPVALKPQICFTLIFQLMRLPDHLECSKCTQNIECCTIGQKQVDSLGGESADECNGPSHIGFAWLQEDFAMGAVSGAFAAAATTPLDVIKTHMMCTAASRPSMVSSSRIVWQARPSPNKKKSNLKPALLSDMSRQH